ncbi:DUF4065 domain-containing protein [Porticoccaceae bacterium]|nr:DUF4065 domain-containing protein [Porticoccaceae bacterium]
MEPVHVANFFLTQARKEDDPITTLKLLKLVYIGYGWAAAVLDRKLFDEPIEAWAHGPVVESIYHEFKHFGSAEITEMGVYYNLESSEVTEPHIPNEEKEVLKLLGLVWGIYKRFSAWDLRDKTHELGTPWSDVFRAGKSNIEIGHEAIREHFKVKIMEYLNHDRSNKTAA